MIRDDIVRLIEAFPFEPFRLRLVTGDCHDIFDPDTVAVMSATVMIASRDGNWIIFPLDKLAAVESLIADFHGQAAEHGA